MKKEILKYICCPLSHDKLKIEDCKINLNEEIESGILKSTNGEMYPIINGIPNLIPFSGLHKTTENTYERITKPYDDVLLATGIAASKVAQMDSLRYSISSLANKLIIKYMKGLVLDLGAGMNYMHNEYSYLSECWISADYDIRTNTIDVQADGQHLPFFDNIFDTIISIDVLEHVPEPDKFISEIFRVLKPGGIVILSTPFFFWHHEEPHDYFRFSRYGIRVIFEKNKFEVIDVIPIAGILSIIGILFSVLFTKIFKFSNLLIKLFFYFNKIIQLKLIYPLDKKIDKRKRFAQGHFIIAKK